MACSGCITSAEGVLIGQQSQDEVLRVLTENREHKQSDRFDQVLTTVCTLSQQSILSLAQKFGLTDDIEAAAQRVAGYLKEIGFDWVIDTKVADDLALIESRTEFVERFKSENIDQAARPTLPMLASSCPGWVCYAEKTHGSFILPYISSTRSPQQIMGMLVKTVLAQKLGVGAAKVYHVTVMPCYDKKLEASREDFYSEVNDSKDVDCVITSSKYKRMSFYYFQN